MRKHACKNCEGDYCVAWTSEFGYLCANCRRFLITFKGNDEQRRAIERLNK